MSDVFHTGLIEYCRANRTFRSLAVSVIGKGALKEIRPADLPGSWDFGKDSEIHPSISNRNEIEIIVQQ